MAIRVAKADLSDPAVRDLIELHQRGMLDESPPLPSTYRVCRGPRLRCLARGTGSNCSVSAR